LSGAEHRLSEHIEFRYHSSEISEKFRSLVLWLLQAIPKLTPLQHIVDLRYIAKEYGWQRSYPLGKTFCAVALKLSPYPNSGGNRNLVPINLLQWNVAMNDALSGSPFITCSWSRRVRTPQAVFRATVRTLQDWIFGASSALRRERELSILWKKAEEANGIDVCAWRPLELAYVLMRRAFGAFHDLGSPSSEVEIADEPVIGVKTYQGRLPRMAYRALYLAVFAEYYHIIKRASGNGVAMLQDLSSLPLSNLVVAFDVPYEVDSRLNGGVLFFSVPEMPIKPFV
jgi:hypothetical protein